MQSTVLTLVIVVILFNLNIPYLTLNLNCVVFLGFCVLRTGLWRTAHRAFAYRSFCSQRTGLLRIAYRSLAYDVQSNPLTRAIKEPYVPT